MAATSPTKPRRSVVGPALIPMGHHAGKPPIPLVRPVSVVGSRSSARIHLISSSVSKAHALLVRSDARTYIRDLASRTGVIVNGQQVREAILSDGDEIQIGKFTFKYAAGPGEDRPLRAPAPPAPPARLDVAGAQFPVPIDQRVLLIGRRSTCDVHLLEDSVSTAHAVIFEMDGKRYIRDLGSRTGTFVNGVSTHQHALSPGDRIRIGQTDIRYVPEPLESMVPAQPQPSAQPDSTDALPVSSVTTATPDMAVEPEPLMTAAATGSLELDSVLDLAPPAEQAPPPALPDEQPVIHADTASASTEPPASAADDAPAIGPEPAPHALDAIPLEETAPTISGDMPPPAADESVPQPEVVPLPLVSPSDTRPPAATDSESALPRRGWRAGSETPSEPPAPDATELDQSASTADDEHPLKFSPSDSPLNTSADDSFAPIAADAGGAAELDLNAPGLKAPTVGDANPPAGALANTPLELNQSLLSGDIAPDEPEPPQQRTDLGIDASRIPPPTEQPGPTSPDTVQLQSLDLSLPPAAASQSLAASEPIQPLAVESAPLDAAEPVSDADQHESRPLIAALSLPDTPDTPPDMSDTTPPAPPSLNLEAAADQALSEPLEPGELISPVPEPAVAFVPPPLESEQLTAAITPPAADEQAPPLAFAPPAEATPDITLSSEPTQTTEQARVEVVEPTEPTTESALQSAAEQLALDLPEGSEEPAAAESAATSAVDQLTDTTFDRAVREFTGSEIGEIVEPPEPSAASPQPQGSTPAVPAVSDTRPTPAPEDADPAASAATPAAPPPSAGPQIPWGANQDNFLGGQPLDLRRPVPEAAVQELIQEIDTVADAAERAASRPTWPSPARSEIDEPPIIPAIPPRPRRPQVFRSLRRRTDEMIPPFDPGAYPPADVAPPTAARGTALSTGFDALAMPPVRQMDVFSQMSPPAMDDAEATAEALLNETPVSPMTFGPVPDAVSEETGGWSVSRQRGTPTAVAHATEAAPQAASSQTPASADQPTPLPQDGPPDVAASEPMRRRPPSSPPPTPPPMRRPVMTPAVAFADPEFAEFAASAARRRYLRRIPILLGIMVLMLGGASWAVMSYLGVRSTIEGRLMFKNVAALTKPEREAFHARQRELLKDDFTRRNARTILTRRNARIAPGFLDEQIDYFKVADGAEFSESHPDVMVIRVQGTKPADNVARVSAMLEALYSANEPFINEARIANRKLEDLTNTIEKNRARLDELNAEIEKLRMLGQSGPGAERIRQIEQELAEAESRWNDAVAAVKTAEAELARLQSMPVAPTTGSATATADEQALEHDEKLRAMQAQLAELQEKAAAARSEQAAQAEAARQALDQALDAFQKQIADAQNLSADNPETAAYVKAAEQLQQTTRTLTDELIRRQEQQFARLMELKQRLNEKMEARRIELWKNDKQLQELTERQAILTRQYNAAVGGGLAREAEEKKVELELTNNMIKARQDLLPGDSFYAEAISQLQAIIDSTRKNIEEDRRKTEQLLTTLQQSFAASQSPEKLPAEQRQLAETLQKQLAQINAARAQYNQAVDAAGSGEAVDPQLKTRIATLQAGIDARRQQLAEEMARTQQAQANRAAIQAKQEDLAQLKQAEASAQQDYFTKHKQLLAARSAQAEARAAGEKLDELIREKDRVQRTLQANIADVDNARRQVARAVEPIQPTQADVIVHSGEDRRLVYLVACWSAILLLFAGLILWTLHTAHHEPAYLSSLQATDLGVPPRAVAQPVEPIEHPGPAGPPKARANDHDSEQDHAAAAV
ncbi:FHA domain-containing protein [Fontivita pretiosa]|uniref:FHA domain-containing protein n=1 Tax=Fontivita pretiosa TaxID=2989684 RepID=UPI003D17D13E